MACDMCGSDTFVKLGLVEGVQMNLCAQCASFANKMIEPQKEKTSYKPVRQKPEEKEFAIIPHYARAVQQALNRVDKKNEDIAKELNIKESVLSHFATGKRKPSLEMAKKLERYFNIRLIVEVEETSYEPSHNNAHSGSLTLGDFIKKK